MPEGGGWAKSGQPHAEQEAEAEVSEDEPLRREGALRKKNKVRHIRKTPHPPRAPDRQLPRPSALPETQGNTQKGMEGGGPINPKAP